MLEIWQNLPSQIEPVAFTIGSFEIHWYSLMYLVGFAVVYFLLEFRIENLKFGMKSGTQNYQIKDGWPRAEKLEIRNSANKEYLIIDKNILLDLSLYLIIGLLIGGRLGYVFFYDFSYFIHHPLEIFLPFHFEFISHNAYPLLYNTGYSGFAGMSYHGGLIGVILAGTIFARRNKINFWKLADFVIPAIPAGYFFGRIGNFLNGELYGRATDVPWGMYFSDRILRHPSQLYEAFFEGLVLFLILWFLKSERASQWSIVNGQLFSIYIFGYGFFRFFIEFFRQPDTQNSFIPYVLTMGQIFSVAMMVIAVLLFFWRKRKIVIL